MYEHYRVPDKESIVSFLSCPRLMQKTCNLKQKDGAPGRKERRAWVHQKICLNMRCPNLVVAYQAICAGKLMSEEPLSSSEIP